MKQLFVTAIFIAAIMTGNCIAQDKKTKSSEVEKEYSVDKNATIRINNTNKNIQIKSWKEDKVKIMVSGVVVPENTETDDLLESLGITIRQSGSNFTISIKEGSYPSTVSSSNSDVFSNQTQPIVLGSGSSSNSAGFSNPVSPEANTRTIIGRNTTGVNHYPRNKPLTIFVPQSGKLRIDSRYGNLSFTNTFDVLDLDITNGNTDAENIGNLNLISKYGNFTCGDIKNGTIDFINGRFTANNAQVLDMDTKYSTIEINTVNELAFLSTNDEYEVEEAGQLTGRKNYGNFHINKLNHSFSLDGTNADVKIRNISPSLSLIKIDDKYADLRLPLKNVKNYSFEVTGAYNTVYSVNGTETTLNLTEDQEGVLAAALALSANGTKTTSEVIRLDVPMVKGKVGTGSNAKVSVKCQNCTIDLK